MPALQTGDESQRREAIAGKHEWSVDLRHRVRDIPVAASQPLQLARSRVRRPGERDRTGGNREPVDVLVEMPWADEQIPVAMRGARSVHDRWNTHCPAIPPPNALAGPISRSSASSNWHANRTPGSRAEPAHADDVARAQLEPVGLLARDLGSGARAVREHELYHRAAGKPPNAPDHRLEFERADDLDA